jgi:aryl carrier-like protein
MNDLEHALRDALARLLQVEASTLPLDADLGEQGVDSLVALQFARDIRPLAGGEVDLEWLYDHSSIQRLAAFLAARRESAAAVPSST